MPRPPATPGADDDNRDWPSAIDGGLGRLEHLPPSPTVPPWHPEASPPASSRPRLRDMRFTMSLGALFVLACVAAALPLVECALNDQPWDWRHILISWATLLLTTVLIPASLLFLVAAFALLARRRSR
ncbi:hypothetical protein [Streptoalloteichus hindustanus]|uniref:Uncharacterized protein n=1 Tax=Streptoalloteichus hindustanus TaxID=2017 RepID=A0A1M5DAI8_STRHI|nr:hypothetical protein [Streptoalloteichus hindustanus]SHF63895.1 hypothetical protein SAMN05444320_104365 [Streptoalloteichus hindustanus]